MQVNVFEEDTITPHALGADLREVCGDDELKRAGRYWIGGGAAPLFYLTCA